MQAQEEHLSDSITLRFDAVHTALMKIEAFLGIVALLAGLSWVVFNTVVKLDALSGIEQFMCFVGMFVFLLFLVVVIVGLKKNSLLFLANRIQLDNNIMMVLRNKKVLARYPLSDLKDTISKKASISLVFCNPDRQLHLPKSLFKDRGAELLEALEA